MEAEAKSGQRSHAEEDWRMVKKQEDDRTE